MGVVGDTYGFNLKLVKSGAIIVNLLYPCEVLNVYLPINNKIIPCLVYVPPFSLPFPL